MDMAARGGAARSTVVLDAPFVSALMRLGSQNDGDRLQVEQLARSVRLIASRRPLSFSHREAVDGKSAQQGDKLNVFISYSRDDLAFADQLDAALGPLALAQPSTGRAFRPARTGKPVSALSSGTRITYAPATALTVAVSRS